jgi:hypothetical protein
VWVKIVPRVKLQALKKHKGGWRQGLLTHQPEAEQHSELGQIVLRLAGPHLPLVEILVPVGAGGVVVVEVVVVVPVPVPHLKPKAGWHPVPQ